MPVIICTCNAPEIRYSGQWMDLNAGGHNARVISAENSQVDLKAHCADLTMLSFNVTGTQMAVQVDGGAWTDLPIQTNWGSLTLFTGLPDASHTVCIRHRGGASAFYMDRDTAFTLSGSAPALENRTDFGPMYPLVMQGQELAQEGGWKNLSAAGYVNPPLRVSPWPDAAIFFKAKCESIRIWTHLDGSGFQFMVDGADAGGMAVTPSLGQYGWQTIATGLDPSVEHEYGISVSRMDYPTIYLYALMLVGGAGLISSPMPGRATLAFYGDSLVVGAGGTGADSSHGMAHMLGLRKKIAVLNAGVSASTVHRFNTGPSGVTTRAGDATERLPDLTALSPAPSHVVVMYGTNDLGQIGGPESLAAFEESYRHMLTTLVAAMPATRFLCAGILPRSDYPAVSRAPWSDIIGQAAGGFHRENVRFISMEGVISDAPGSIDLFDGVHPTPAGYAKIADALEEYAGFTSEMEEVIVSAGAL